MNLVDAMQDDARCSLTYKNAFKLIDSASETSDDTDNQNLFEPEDDVYMHHSFEFDHLLCNVMLVLFHQTKEAVRTATFVNCHKRVLGLKALEQFYFP